MDYFRGVTNGEYGHRVVFAANGRIELNGRHGGDAIVNGWTVQDNKGDGRSGAIVSILEQS